MQDYYHYYYHHHHDYAADYNSSSSSNCDLRQQHTPWQQQQQQPVVDWEAVHYVVLAYLNENSTTLAHVQEADRFVRKVVSMAAAASSSESYNPRRRRRRRESINSNSNSNINAAITTVVSPNNVTGMVAAVSSSSSSSSWRVFDRLLGAYSPYMKITTTTTSCQQASISNSNKINKQALESSNQLFQFFMIAHRKGHLVGSGEEPDCYHLGHVLRQWNLACRRQSSSSSSSSSSSTGTGDTAKLAAAKSLEYYRLFSNGIASCQPDVFNVRQVLGTLAKSGQTGYQYGRIAEQLLNKTLLQVIQTSGDYYSTSKNPSSSTVVVDVARSSTRTAPATRRLDPYALGHMFWCVIACHCQDEWIMEHHYNDDTAGAATASTCYYSTSGIPAAMNVLKRLEDLHARQPQTVFLTGASYQTIVSYLADRMATARKAIGKDCSNEMDQQVPSSSSSSLLSQRCARIAVEIVQRAEAQFYRNGNTRVRLLGQLYKDALECCKPLLLLETNDDATTGEAAAEVRQARDWIQERFDKQSSSSSSSLSQ
jgi:hypothetical protein